METITTKQKPKRVFGILFMILGSFFLFNPDVMVIDFLPDAIGYILILFGIRRLIDFNAKIAKARKLLFRCLLVGALQLFSIWLLFVFLSDYERPAMTLIATMLVVAGNALFGILGFKSLFEGLEKLSSQASDDAFMLSSKKEGKRSEVDRIKYLTYALLITRAVFAILPEISSLSWDEYTRVSPLFEHVSAMRFLSFIPPLILGIIWLVKSIRFWVRTGRDEPVMDYIDRRYHEEFEHDEGLAVHHAFSSGFVAFEIGTVFLLPVFIDGKNYLPSFLALVFFTIGVIYTRKFLGGKKLLLLSLSRFSVLSVAALAIQYWYFGQFSMSDIDLYLRIDETAASFLWLIRLTALLESAAALFFLFALYKSYISIIDNYTGLTISEHSEPEFMQRRVLETQKRMKKKLILPFALGGGTILLYAVFFLVFVNYPWFSLLSTIVGLAFAFDHYMVLGSLMEAIERKYYINE